MPAAKPNKIVRQAHVSVLRENMCYIIMLYKYTLSRGFMCVYLRCRFGQRLHIVQQAQGVWGMDSGGPMEPFLLEAWIPQGKGQCFGGPSKHKDVGPTLI